MPHKLTLYLNYDISNRHALLLLSSPNNNILYCIICGGIKSGAAGLYQVAWVEYIYGSFRHGNRFENNGSHSDQFINPYIRVHVKYTTIFY